MLAWWCCRSRWRKATAFRPPSSDSVWPNVGFRSSTGEVEVFVRGPATRTRSTCRWFRAVGRILQTRMSFLQFLQSELAIGGNCVGGNHRGRCHPNTMPWFAPRARHEIRIARCLAKLSLDLLFEFPSVEVSIGDFAGLVDQQHGGEGEDPHFVGESAIESL